MVRLLLRVKIRSQEKRDVWSGPPQSQPPPSVGAGIGPEGGRVVAAGLQRGSGCGSLRTRNVHQ